MQKDVIVVVVVVVINVSIFVRRCLLLLCDSFVTFLVFGLFDFAHKENIMKEKETK